MHDLKLAFRQLIKSPGFTAVAVLTLALGIGACATTFSLVNAVLLQPLSFREPDRLVWFENWNSNTLSNQTSRVDNFLDWRTQTESFEDLAAFNAFFELNRYALMDGTEPQRLRGVQISQNFLQVLGVQPLLGRGFTVDECMPQGKPAVMLSHAFWQQQFASDPTVVGQLVEINGRSVPIVGILPPEANLELLFSPGSNVELLLPLPLAGEILNGGNTIITIGRLNPGFTIEQAREEMAVVSARILKAHPERAGYSPETGPSLTLLDEHIHGPFRPAFLLLSIAVLVVWLIACINLSNLLLARADARRPEYAMRAALGATRWHLLRQTLTESLMIAGAGCALGVYVAFMSVASLSKLEVFSIPLLQTAAVNGPTLLMAAVMAGVSAIVCGSLPALQLWRQDPGEVLAESTTRGTTGKSGTWMRRTLVTTEIALACMLLVGASLLARSFANVLHVELGFQPGQVLSWRVDTVRTFDSPLARDAYYDGLIDRVASVPGVESVGLSDSVPLGYRRSWPVRATGATQISEQNEVGYVRLIDEHNLQTMRTPLLRGRYFNDGDTRNAQKVAIISATLARNIWQGEDPIGKIAEIMRANNDNRDLVVGVVADVVHGLEQAPQPDVYLNFRQLNPGVMSPPQLVVRIAGSHASRVSEIRAAIHEYDATLPSNEFIPLDQIVDQAIAPRRLTTGILGSFSSFALLLAAIGLYGVVAFAIGRRTREFGVRLAIGAQRRDILWLVVRDVLSLAGVGVATGLIGAYFLTWILRSQLFGVTATDPLTFVTNAIAITSVALLAAAVPARRAMRINPTEALRAE